MVLERSCSADLVTQPGLELASRDNQMSALAQSGYGPSRKKDITTRGCCIRHFFTARVRWIDGDKMKDFVRVLVDATADPAT
jgi:hypothetical protein